MNRNTTWPNLTIFIALAILSNVAQAASVIFGVGANFPKQVYKEWGKQYKTETGTDFVYIARGSDKGIESILSGKSDFGASDKPLKTEEALYGNARQGGNKKTSQH